MAIGTTSASAIAARQAVLSVPEPQRATALFTLVVLTGLALAVFGLLRLGLLVRYVPYSVMQGFLFGVSLVLLLDQLAPTVGYSPSGGNELLQFWDLLTHVGSWDVPSVIIGVVALVLVLVLNRTRLATWSTLIGLLVPTVLLLVVGWPTVQQVREVSPIPRGLPAVTLPSLDLLSVPMVLAALSMAAVIAIQGAGVSQSIDNPDGSSVDVSTDMLAQGAGNVASGLLGGIPVGGSVGQTALVMSAGAKSRWVELLCAVWMFAIILFLGPVIELVPMPALGALMVVAAISSIKPRDVISIVRTNPSAAVGFLLTLAASLVLSVPAALALGVSLAIAWNLVRVSSDVTVRQLVREDDGALRETDAPAVLPDAAVTILTVYGDLFFAGTQTLQEKLPMVAGSTKAVVVLRMRDVNNIGATLVDVLDDYADDLAGSGGALFLAGVNDEIARQLRTSGKLALGDAVHVVPRTDYLGEATARAQAAAEDWLAGHRDQDAPRAGRRPRRFRMVLPEGALQPPQDMRDETPADAGVPHS